MKQSIVEFCERYCQVGNQTYNNAQQSYLAVHPKVKPSTAATQGSALLKRQDVIEKIQGIREKRYQDALGTKERIILELLTNVKLARSRGQISAANKALELVGRELQMFVERQEIKQEGSVEIKTSEDVRAKALELLKEISKVK
jgi:hypothetical protein